MTDFTDRGLREVGQGLREAKALVRRERADLQSQMGIIEARLSALGKIETALDVAIDIMRAEQSKREAEQKAKEMVPQ